NALHLPGIAILHDTFLNGAFESLERFGYISKDRRVVEKKLGSTKKNLSEYLHSISNNQNAIILHSEYAEDSTRDVAENANLEILQLPVSTPTMKQYHDTSFLIGLAGIIADVKGLQIIEMLASSP